MYKPVSLKCFLAFLEYKGFRYDRTKASHHHYKKPGKRTVTIQGNEKEVPPRHIQTNCRTIGCSTDYFYEWAAKNC